MVEKKNMFSHRDFMNCHQKDWWEGILVTDLFESVTICKFREGNFGANTFSHGNLSFVTKSVTNDVLVTVFCETVTIYIFLWILVTLLIYRDCMGTYRHKFHIDRNQIHREIFWTYGHGVHTIVTKVHYLF